MGLDDSLWLVAYEVLLTYILLESWYMLYLMDVLAYNLFLFLNTMLKH